MVSMNTIKGGANLTSPKLSVGYIVGASVGIAVLMGAAGIAGFLMNKTKQVTSGLSSGAGEMFAGAFGDGST